MTAKTKRKKYLLPKKKFFLIQRLEQNKKINLGNTINGRGVR